MEASSVTKMRENGDRISSLPDEVLCHILSFLPTKYSVRTRLLSYRWNHLFAYVPVLDFNFCSYHPRASHRRFVDFVNWVLSLYNVPQMIKFRIDWETSTSQKYRDILICWISSAISCNVQELDITVYPKENLKLPYELFFCNTLSSLKVQGWFYLKLPSSALLPCLKILHFAFVKFDSSTKRILSACPVLEDLYLRRCIFKDVLNLSNPTLKKLWIEECHDYVLVLNAPSLLQFDFLSSRINGIISEIESPLLVTACIRPESYASINSKKLKVTMKKLVNVVSHAKHLYLSSSSLEAFQVSYEELPKFCNLKRLEIAHVSSIVLELLPYLLDKSSHMEVLIFATGFSKEKSNVTGLIGFRNVPSCVSLNLKVIVFKGFSAKENESKLVEYFLKNAKVLDKMIIQVHRMSMEEKDAFSKKLLTFSKFSSDCQIVIKESCQ